MGVTIDESAVDTDWRMTQGDGWPDEPVEFAVTLDDEETPVTGLIESARLQVKAAYGDSATLAELDTADVGSPLTISGDGSTVRLAAGAVPGSTTAEWPSVDPDAKPAQQVPLVWDVETILVATGEPDTLAGGRIYVEPDVTE